MNTVIKKALDSTGIENTFIEREPNIFPYIVYYYKEYTNSKADCIEENQKYDVYFNLYVKKHITANIKKIKEALEMNGFKKVVINTPIKFKGTDYYQVTMNYTKLYTERND